MSFIIPIKSPCPEWLHTKIRQWIVVVHSSEKKTHRIDFSKSYKVSPRSYKWSCVMTLSEWPTNKWVTGFKTLLIGVRTPFTTSMASLLESETNSNFITPEISSLNNSPDFSGFRIQRNLYHVTEKMTTPKKYSPKTNQTGLDIRHPHFKYPFGKENNKKLLLFPEIFCEGILVELRDGHVAIPRCDLFVWCLEKVQKIFSQMVI